MSSGMSVESGKVCVRVPASTANLGPGFDVLGMALDLYAWVEMSAAETTSIELHGEQLAGVPTDKSNLIYEIAQKVFARAGVALPELRIAMYSDIPLTRGLGSSASAIVGALVAANALVGEPFSREQLFHMAAAEEGHPDNVGASLFGGIVVAHWDGVTAHHIRIEPAADLHVLVAVPDFHLSTSLAREALPRQLTLADAVHNIGQSSLLVAAFASGRLDMIGHAMDDRLHQPYRAPLIPGMSRILQEATAHGALGAALSGAGPTLLALVDARSARKQELAQFLQETLTAEGIRAQLLWLRPDVAGACKLTPYDENSTFIATIEREKRG